MVPFGVHIGVYVVALVPVLHLHTGHIEAGVEDGVVVEEVRVCIALEDD